MASRLAGGEAVARSDSGFTQVRQIVSGKMAKILSSEGYYQPMMSKKPSRTAALVVVLVVGLTITPGLGAAASSADCGDRFENKVYSSGDETVYQDPSTGETCTETDSDDPDTLHEIRTEMYQTVLGDDNAGSCLADAVAPGTPEEELVGSQLTDRLGFIDTFASITSECGPL